MGEFLYIKQLNCLQCSNIIRWVKTDSSVTRHCWNSSTFPQLFLAVLSLELEPILALKLGYWVRSIFLWTVWTLATTSHCTQCALSLVNLTSTLTISVVTVPKFSFTFGFGRFYGKKTTVSDSIVPNGPCLDQHIINCKPVWNPLKESMLLINMYAKLKNDYY